MQMPTYLDPDHNIVRVEPYKITPRGMEELCKPEGPLGIIEIEGKNHIKTLPPAGWRDINAARQPVIDVTEDISVEQANIRIENGVTIRTGPLRTQFKGAPVKVNDELKPDNTSVWAVGDTEKVCGPTISSWRDQVGHDRLCDAIDKLGKEGES
jgi:hypothetical protein